MRNSQRKDRTKTIYYKVADWLCSKYSSEDDIKYVAMFLDMMAFQIFESILILTIGWCLGIFIETALVVLSFILARVRYKGIHSSSRKLCVLYSILLIIGVSHVSSAINPLISPIMGYMIGVLMRDRSKIEKGNTDINNNSK